MAWSLRSNVTSGHTRRHGRGRRVRRASGNRIVELLDEHHAVVNAELQARIAEAGYRNSGLNIDPHHVTTALRRLYADETIVNESAETRGGREITTIRLARVRRRETKIAIATRRKRVLMARYQGWSQGTKRHPHGLIGPAGEAAVRAAILQSGAMQPAADGAGPVSSLLDTILSGPVDSAGFMVPIQNGIPQSPVTVVVEVKNLRSWIYPSSLELYQLLSKSSALQRAHPEQPIVGLLVCRRAHPTTYWMAKQLGFALIEMDTQFAGPADPADLDEVRNELYFTDIRPGSGPSLRVRDRLAKSELPRVISVIADNWRETALNDAMATAILGASRRSKSVTRLRYVDQIRALAVAEGQRGGW